MKIPAGMEQLWREIEACQRCPRLIAYGSEVSRKRRRAFAQEIYWGRPVPSFGDPQARLLLVGLAPAAHGAHRTGRMFTGDRSGDFLYAALHRAGFASSAVSRSRDDGLELRDAFLTASARCAPPGNRPTPAEFAQCRPYLEREMDLLPRLRVVMTLGRLAHDQLLAVLQARGWVERRSAHPFSHGAEFEVGGPRPGGLLLFGCYHPSQQNTFTGRLTETMLDRLLQRVRQRLEAEPA